MSQGAAQQEPEQQRQFQHGGGDQTCRGITDKDNTSDTATLAMAERENSLAFGAAGVADGPTADVDGVVAALLLHHHFYTPSHPRQPAALFWEHQLLGNLPLEWFEVVHLVGCVIIQDTPEGSGKGEHAHSTQTGPEQAQNIFPMRPLC